MPEAMGAITMPWPSENHPRNHLNLRHKPVRFGRAFFIGGDAQNAGQIAVQFNFQFAVLGDENDGIDEGAEDVGCNGGHLRVPRGDASEGDMTKPAIDGMSLIGTTRPSRSDEAMTA